MTDYAGTSGSSSGMRRTISAMFDSRAAAEDAVEALLEEGFPRSDVRLVPGHEKDVDSGSASTMSDSTISAGRGGFWESLSDFFFPDEDRDMYAEGLRRGGYLVTVTTSEARYERALDILDDEGTIDLDERAESWRAEGWSGMASTGQSTGAGQSSYERGGEGLRSTGDSRMPGATTPGGASTGSSAIGSAAGSMASGTGMGARRTGAEGEEVIPVAEEELRIGKREVHEGRVRVRSYVVEQPVSEDVTLRREHVDVQRRPVDRATTAGEELFRERSIELDEKAEQPVVSKEARVREEVVVRKDVEHERGTVSDTVRRTEVEVEDDRKTGAMKREDRRS